MGESSESTQVKCVDCVMEKEVSLLEDLLAGERWRVSQQCNPSSYYHSINTVVVRRSHQPTQAVINRSNRILRKALIKALVPHRLIVVIATP